MQSFDRYYAEFEKLLDVVLRRYPKARGSSVQVVIERRARLEYDKQSELSVSDVLEIVEDTVRRFSPSTVGEAGATAKKSDANSIAVTGLATGSSRTTSLPGRESRDAIRAAIRSKSSLSKKNLQALDTESNNRIVQLCAQFKMSEEQLFAGYKQLDNAGPINWRPPGAKKGRKPVPWPVEKAVFRHYLAGTSLAQIPVKVREEFSELGLAVEVPDPHEPVANVMMAIRAIPLLAAASLMLLASACRAAAFKVRNNSSVGHSFGAIAIGAGKGLVVIAVSGGVVVAAVALPLLTLARGCNHVACAPNNFWTGKVNDDEFGRPKMLELLPAPDAATGGYGASEESANDRQMLPSSDQDPGPAPDAGMRAADGQQAGLPPASVCGFEGESICGNEMEGHPVDELALYTCEAGKYKKTKTCETNCYPTGGRANGASTATCEPSPPLPRTRAVVRCGDSKGNDRRTIYRCDANGASCKAIFTCEQECVPRGQSWAQCNTQPTECPAGLGWHCGGEVGAGIMDLFECAGGKLHVRKRCGSGCGKLSESNMIWCDGELYVPALMPRATPAPR